MNGATPFVSVRRTEPWPFLSSPGAGAVIGIMTAGPIADALLHRAGLDARALIATAAAAGTVVLFLPALLTRSASPRSLTP